MTEKDIVDVLCCDGYHAAVKLIEKKPETIEGGRSLILWKDGFVSENRWKSLYVALDVPEDTITSELKYNVVAVSPYRK